MANGPDAFYLDKLRKLQGTPSITSPESNGGSLKVERVKTVPQGDTLPAYGEPDPDPTYAAAGARLTLRSITGSDNTNQEVYTCYEALGTRAQQDVWNEHPRTFPYGSELYPRITRKYRFFFDNLPEFVTGQTTDTVVSAATLIDLSIEDESAVVRVFTTIFDDIPSEAEQAALGGNGGLGVTVSYPEGARAFPLVSWKFRVLNGTYTPATDNEACPIPGYTDLVLTDQGRAPSDDQPAAVAVETREYQLLPGAVVSSEDAAHLPRTLTATPSYYLNGDKLTTTKKKVVYGTEADAVTATVLSSKVDSTSTLFAVKTNVTRANPDLPTVYLPVQVGDYGGADGAEYRLVVQVDDSSALNAAVAAAVALVKDLFHVVNYSTVPLSPTQVELHYTQIDVFPELVGAEANASIPEKFLKGFTMVDTTDWVDTSTVAAADQLVSGNGVISCKISPETSRRGKRVTVSLPAGSTLPTLVSERRNGKGQVETITEQVGYNGALTFPELTALIPEASLEDLGGGWYLSTVATITGVFAGYTYKVSIPNVIPEEFRALLAESTTEETLGGAASMPSLGTGDISASSEQLDEFLVRVSRTSLGTATGTLTGKEIIGGQVATVTKTLGTGNALTAGALTLEGDVRDLGNGSFVVTTKTVASFPVLTGGKWEDATQIAEKFTVQKMATADAALLVGNAGVDVTPLDDVRSEVRTRSIDATALATYHQKFPAMIPEIEFPDVLYSVGIELNTSAASGASTETGSSTTVGSGSLNLAIPNSAQSAVSIIPDVTPVIQRTYARNVPAVDHYFIVAIGTTASAVIDSAGASAWPVFQPRSQPIVCKGQKVSGRASANVRMSTSFSESGASLAESHGTGYDADISLVTRTVIIPPTIHGEIDLGTCTFTQSVSVAATSSIGPVSATKSLTFSCKASVSPGVLGATGGINAIPTTGIYAHDVHSEPYKDDYIVVRVRTVDFANLVVSGATADTLTTALADAAATLVTDTASGYSGNPTVTSQPSSATTAAGSNATLSTAGTGTGPVSFQWYAGDPDGANAPIDSATGSSYTTGTAGSYYAVITDGFGSTTTTVATVTLTTSGGGGGGGTGPTILTQPVNAAIATDSGFTHSSASLSVVADGTGTLTYQWAKDGTPLPSGWASGGGTTSSTTDATLVISDATAADAGSYTCTVTDTTGSVTSAAGVLTVYDIVIGGITSGANVTSNTFAGGTTTYFSYPMSLTCSPAPTSALVFTLQENNLGKSTTSVGHFKAAASSGPPYLTTPQFTVASGATTSNTLHYFPPDATPPGSSHTGGPVELVATAGTVVASLVFGTVPP